MEDNPWKDKGKLVKANAGDLILWDSRTIHAGYTGIGFKKG